MGWGGGGGVDTPAYDDKWYITIPNLVTKDSMVQKILPGQKSVEILNICCDLEQSNFFFLGDTLAYELMNLMMIKNQTTLGCKRRLSSEDVTIAASYILMIQVLTVSVTLTMKRVIYIFEVTLHLTFVALPCQVWLQNVQRFRRNLLNKAWTDTVIPVTTPLNYWGGGGGGSRGVGMRGEGERYTEGKELVWIAPREYHAHFSKLDKVSGVCLSVLQIVGLLTLLKF